MPRRCDGRSRSLPDWPSREPPGRHVPPRVGRVGDLPYRGGSDDIDLDATLDRLVEHPVPEDEDIIVRDRIRTRRSVVLAVDISGSMRGERVRTAAATVGALVGELARDDLGVIVFWSDAALIADLGQRVSAGRILDMLVRLPAAGLTNIAFPLQIAARVLAGPRSRCPGAAVVGLCPQRRARSAPGRRGPASRGRVARYLRRAGRRSGVRHRSTRARPPCSGEGLPRRRRGPFRPLRPLRRPQRCTAQDPGVSSTENVAPVAVRPRPN